MRDDVREALDSACSVGISRFAAHEARPQKRTSFVTVRAIVLAVIRELPEDMTINELREALEDASPE